MLANSLALAGLYKPLADALTEAMRYYVLLIMILVAFLEAAAQKLAPQPPAVVMGFAGLSHQ